MTFYHMYFVSVLGAATCTGSHLTGVVVLMTTLFYNNNNNNNIQTLAQNNQESCGQMRCVDSHATKIRKSSTVS